MHKGKWKINEKTLMRRGLDKGITLYTTGKRRKRRGERKIWLKAVRRGVEYG
jgi:hypothetical protein